MELIYFLSCDPNLVNYMKLKTILTTVLFLSFLIVIAQRKADPTPEEISKAKKLKEEYEDDDIAILSSTENVSFNLDKKSNKVSVSHKIEE